MTKTLTEQWCEGTLPDGYYYVVSKWSGKIEINDCYDGCWQDLKEEYIKEVLAPVPSYTEVKEMSQKIESLEKKLAIAVKCLKEYADPEQWEDCTDENGVPYFKGLLCDYGHSNAGYALKQIEEVKYE